MFSQIFKNLHILTKNFFFEGVDYLKNSFHNFCFKLGRLDSMMDFSGQQRLLPGMRPRPEIILVDKKNGKETVTSKSNSTFIFLRNCENYELKIEGKAAKIMCENCKSVTVELGRSLVSGTFELLRCRDAFIKLINECEVRCCLLLLPKCEISSHIID